MKRQLTAEELLNIPAGQLWSLEIQQRLAEAGVPSAFPIVSSSVQPSPLPAQLNNESHGMESLASMEQERAGLAPTEHALSSTDFMSIGNARTGRPFKKPSFPIKAIWCKTVICLMDMECDLPERLDFTVSPLHGLPRYLTAKEDFLFNRGPDCAQARWRVYSPLRNYVGSEVEEMVEFICAIDGCNKIFKTRDLVVNHVFGFHKIFPPTVFKCNWAECEREDHFGAFYQVETHMQRHKVDRPYVCTVEGCPKSYRRLENLRTHMRTHNGEKPYKCKFEFCDRRFTNASDRAKHENRTHSTIKGFGCYMDECYKLYTDPSSLRKHIINAHGARAYEEHKKMKACERKKKIEQKMLERSIIRSLPEGTGGPIRNCVATTRQCPSTSSQSSATTGNSSLSPRSSNSNVSCDLSPSSQISPLPTIRESSASSATINSDFSMSRILDNVPRPSPPPTTPMYEIQKPIPRTPVVQRLPATIPLPQMPPMPLLPPLPQLPQLPQVYPLLPMLGPFVPPQTPAPSAAAPTLSPQLLNALLLARLQAMNVNHF